MESAAEALESRMSQRLLIPACRLSTRISSRHIGKILAFLACVGRPIHNLSSCAISRYNRQLTPGGFLMAIAQQLDTYVNERRAQFEDLLGQMVEVPSISMDPSR